MQDCPAVAQLALKAQQETVMIATSAEQALGRILVEDVLTPNEARAEIAKATGTRPHIATVYRWIRRPVNGVQLETIRVGRRLITSKQAIHRFLLAQQGR